MAVYDRDWVKSYYDEYGNKDWPSLFRPQFALAHALSSPNCFRCGLPDWSGVVLPPSRGIPTSLGVLR
jgi:hypothetical protein